MVQPPTVSWNRKIMVPPGGCLTDLFVQLATAPVRTSERQISKQMQPKKYQKPNL